MAPCRQLLMWSVPSIAVLLGIFWFRKKRELAKSDPGGRERMKSLQEELAEALNAEAEAIKASPLGKVERSVIKSAPIDILPNGSGSQRSSPLELTDEEIDYEVEKIIKSVKSDKKLPSPDQNCVVKTFAASSSSFDVASTSNKILSPVSENKFVSDEIKNVPDILKNDSEQQGKIEEIEINSHNTTLDTATHACSSVDTLPTEGSAVATEELTEAANVSGDVNDVMNKTRDTSFEAAPRLISERDSANHSPMDPMLASPSMCHFSDNHSEGSSDSGKGCSEAASPPPATINIPTEAGFRLHQFIVPQALVGLLIGKHGSFVQQIKSSTGARVCVRKHPETLKHKICAVEGTQSEIDAALEMIKEKFPEKRFPNFTMQEISPELYEKLVPVVPEFLQLVESVNNETIMTCLVSAGHFFLQQPLHPTFPSLHILHRLMAVTYQNPDVPPLPRPITEGNICAAPTENNWYRAQVISTSEENDTSVVKLVDFGGYLTVDNDQLKQIRGDFMTLPFQATEAILAYVKPANNEPQWCSEALRIMAGLTAGQMLQAQVAGYSDGGLPLVQLFLTIGAQKVIFLNQELVDRELAEWDLPVDA